MMRNYSGFVVDLHGLWHAGKASKLSSIALRIMVLFRFEPLKKYRKMPDCFGQPGIEFQW